MKDLHTKSEKQQQAANNRMRLWMKSIKKTCNYITRVPEWQFFISYNGMDVMDDKYFNGAA